MSVRVMTWVWEHSRSKSTDRLVLLAIADCAADDGANAYPSMAKLVAKTGLTDRGIQKALVRLEALGELVVSRNAGPRGCNRYRVRMVTPEPSSPPNDVHPPEPGTGEPGSPPEQGSPLPPNDVHPDPEPRSPGTVLEPSVEPSKTTSSKSSKRGTRIPDDFTVTPEMRRWAQQHVPQLAGMGETENFVDYWRSRPGVNATKLDWVAAWRLWMRNAANRLPNGRAPTPANGVKPSTTNQRVQAGLDLAAKLDGLQTQKEITA